MAEELLLSEGVNAMTELWKFIEGFERYSVSNWGRIKNNSSGKVLGQRIASNGYLRVNVRTGKIKYEKPKVINVHKLVANAFLIPQEGRHYVNHIDGNKANNNATNLEWVTSKENTAHAIRIGLMNVNSKEHFLKKVNSLEARKKLKASQNTERYRKKQQVNNKNNGLTKSVIQIDKNTMEIINIFDNCYEAARFLFGEKMNNKDRLISRCARGKTKSAYGYTWEYIESDHPLSFL